MNRFYDKNTGVPTLRVGKKLPDNSVNLAYIDSPEVKSEETIELFNYGNRIPENVIPFDVYKADLHAHPGNILADKNNGNCYVPTENILLTNVYKKKGEFDYVPLYFTYTSRSYHYEQDPPFQPDDFNHISNIYIGQNIKIIENDNPTEKEYIIELTPVGATPTNIWRVTVYSEFTSSKDLTYELEYSQCQIDGSKRTYNFKEIFNSDPVFAKVDKDSALKSTSDDKVFAVEKTLSEDGYKVYTPFELDDGDYTPVTNSEGRQYCIFRWRVKKVSFDATPITTYSPWKIDSIYAKNQLYDSEFGDPVVGYKVGEYRDASISTADKLITDNVLWFFDTSVPGTYTFEYQVWDGDWWAADPARLRTDTISSDKTDFWINLVSGAGNNIDSPGELIRTYPAVPVNITVEGFSDGAQVYNHPMTMTNWSKSSLGASATSNCSLYTMSLPEYAIDGRNPGILTTMWTSDIGGSYYGRSKESRYTKDCPVTPFSLTVTLAEAKDIRMLEINTGTRGSFTTVAFMDESKNTIKTISSSAFTVKSSVWQDASFDIKSKTQTGRQYTWSVDDANKVSGVYSIVITVVPERWVTRKETVRHKEKHKHHCLGFSWTTYSYWNETWSDYQSGFDILEVNAYEVNDSYDTYESWQKRASMGFNVSKSNPMKFSISELIAMLDLQVPSAFPQPEKIRYRIYVGDVSHKDFQDIEPTAPMSDFSQHINLSVTQGMSTRVLRKLEGDGRTGVIYLTRDDIYSQPSNKEYYINIESIQEHVYFTKEYSLRTYDNGHIFILPFENYSNSEMWCPKINNGRIVRKNVATNKLYDYSIPEFSMQAFYPVPPYMEVVGEVAEYVDDYHIKVRKTQMFVMYDDDGQPTNLKVYVDINGVETEKTVVNWNEFTGEIQLEDPISFLDTLYVDYYTVVDYYEYRGYYDKTMGKFIYLDLNPSTGHTYTDIETGIERPAVELLTKSVYLYVVPSFILDYTSNVYGGSTSSTLKHIIVDKGTFESDITFPDDAIILGKINLVRSVLPTMIETTDCRQNGGGFKPDIALATIKKIHPEAAFTWDIGSWDGEPYQSNGVIEITIPQSVLKDPNASDIENIGKFSDEEIRDIISQHVAFGVYIFIKYV